MTTLFRDEDEQPDREVTLGMGSLLSIFFGVVLVCGVCFGFGYSMGRRNVQATPNAAVAKKPAAQSTSTDEDSSTETKEATAAPHDDTAPQKSASPDIDGSKPAAKTAHPAAAPPAVPANEAASKPATEKAAKPAHAAVPAAAPVSPTTLAAVQPEHRPAAVGKPRAGIGASGPPPAAPTDEEPVAGRPLMVQIAAVSRQEDAEVLAGALRKRGFSPQVKNGTTDKFFHVQVGPFADKAQAEAMKQHLLADGYNAILK